MSTTAAMSFARSTGHPRRLTLDPWVIGTVAALLLIGLVMVASASIGIAEKETGHAFYYFERQLVYVLGGLVAALVGLAVPTRIWEKFSIYLLVIAFVTLVIVLVPGIGASVNGARRWLRLGVMNFQVSELARVLLLTYISSYAVRRADEMRSSFVGFLKPVGVLAVAAILLLREPDFGAATVLMATGLVVLFIAGVRLYHLLVPVVLGASAMGVLAVSSAYRLRRLIAFRNPWDDPFDSGFQLVQSLIAIGRGEWFGVGLGASVQKLFYLPESHTDFVFAVLAEEFGFVGVAVVIALFALLIGRALKISRDAGAAGLTFQSYLAAAIGVWLGLQSFVNIGVNMGLLPTKGLTLPLLSYGGSSMLVTLGWLGVLLRINHETQSQSGGNASACVREARRA
jgi:cell division protein FtsW